MNATACISYRMLFAPLVFMLLGPTTGVLLLGGDLRVLFLAFMFACMPAVVGGSLYSAICWIHSQLLPERDVSLVVSVAIGALSGLLGMMVHGAVFGGRVFPESDGIAHLYAIGVAAGAVCSVSVSAMVSIERRRLSLPKAQEVESLRNTAFVSSNGRLNALHGLCPKCQAVIPLSALNCPRCDASFDAYASWRPEPLSAEQIAAVEASLIASSSGLKEAPVTFTKLKDGPQIER